MITEYKTMKIDAIHWLTTGYQPGTVGMIEITNAHGERKVYCGAVGSSLNEEHDVKQILDWGGKMSLQAIDSIHEHLHGGNDKP